jgi:transcription initiation factor TFIIIB Brf1 subunit/transcription initiation factor TFIIB
MLNPILSQQLYERKAILRNKECYKIKNPTALKFLLTYDKRIYASHEHFKLSLEDIAEELEIKGKMKNIIQSVEKVIKNLNGYKITETEEIALELVKEGRERYLVVGKKDIMSALPEETVPISLST